MELRQITALSYSATGVTDKVVRTLAEALAAELSLPLTCRSFTKPGEREENLSFGKGELVIVGSPTYAGRMPNKIAPDFQAQLQGSGALAVAAVTFGNRAYENSLAELCALLEAKGFHTVAGGLPRPPRLYRRIRGGPPRLGRQAGHPAVRQADCREASESGNGSAAGGGPGGPGSALLHTQGPGRRAGEVFKGQAKNGPG